MLPSKGCKNQLKKGSYTGTMRTKCISTWNRRRVFKQLVLDGRWNLPNMFILKNNDVCNVQHSSVFILIGWYWFRNHSPSRTFLGKAYSENISVTHRYGVRLAIGGNVSNHLATVFARWDLWWVDRRNAGPRAWLCVLITSIFYAIKTSIFLLIPYETTSAYIFYIHCPSNIPKHPIVLLVLDKITDVPLITILYRTHYTIKTPVGIRFNWGYWSTINLGYGIQSN